MLQVTEYGVWLLAGLALILGGVVKGSLGVGLPLVAVPVISLWLPTSQAIGMLAVPVVLSNLLQAAEGGDVGAGWQRFKGLIVAQFVVTVATVWLTAGLSARYLNLMIALAVLIAVALMTFQPKLAISRGREAQAGVGVGTVAGMLGGASSLTGPVLITYLMSLGLKRDEFVRSISLIYLTSTLPIYGAMLWFGRIAWTDIGLSILALGPVYLGMRAGRAIRQRLDERLFRKIVMLFLIMVAIILLTKE